MGFKLSAQHIEDDIDAALEIGVDYIIIDGYLVGAIVSGEDETESKSFTIPFDLVDNRLQGWVGQQLHQQVRPAIVGDAAAEQAGSMQTAQLLERPSLGGKPLGPG